MGWMDGSRQKWLEASPFYTFYACLGQPLMPSQPKSFGLILGTCPSWCDRRNTFRYDFSDSPYERNHLAPQPDTTIKLDAGAGAGRRIQKLRPRCPTCEERWTWQKWTRYCQFGTFRYRYPTSTRKKGRPYQESLSAIACEWSYVHSAVTVLAAASWPGLQVQFILAMSWSL
jgi:hypothetical protein